MCKLSKVRMVTVELSLKPTGYAIEAQAALYDPNQPANPAIIKKIAWTKATREALDNAIRAMEAELESELFDEPAGLNSPGAQLKLPFEEEAPSFGDYINFSEPDQV